MDNIAFKSSIKPVNISEFYAIANKIGDKCYVKYPWTINQSVMNKDAFTTGVIDCTVCGITDGANVLLTHICPTVKGNMDFKKIENFIKSKLTLMNNKYLQGFLLGSQGTLLMDSRKLFEQFSELLNKLKIPTTKLRAGYSEIHTAYSSANDEWIVACKDVDAYRETLNSERIINEMFEYVEISPLDEIV